MLPGVMNGRCRYEIRISPERVTPGHIFSTDDPPALHNIDNLYKQNRPRIIQHSSILQPLRIITAGSTGGTITTNYVFYMSLHSSRRSTIYSGPWGSNPSEWVDQTPLTGEMRCKAGPTPPMACCHSISPRSGRGTVIPEMSDYFPG